MNLEFNKGYKNMASKLKLKLILIKISRWKFKAIYHIFFGFLNAVN